MIITLNKLNRMLNKLFCKISITVSNGLTSFTVSQVHYFFNVRSDLISFLKEIELKTVYQLLFIIIILIGFLEITKNYLQSIFSFVLRLIKGISMIKFSLTNQMFKFLNIAGTHWLPINCILN